MKLAVTIISICAAGLLALGIVALYSASMTQEERAARKPVPTNSIAGISGERAATEAAKTQTPSRRLAGTRLLTQQVVWGGLGLIGCMIMACMDYRILQKRQLPWIILGVATVLLALVFVPGIGRSAKGATRWIWLGIGDLRLQPSEFAKLAVIIFMAYYGARWQKDMRSIFKGVILPLLIVAPVIALVFREPDRGTTVFLAVISGVILLLAGVRWYILVGPAVVAIVAFVISIANDTMRSGRVYSWLHLEETKDGMGYQVYQGLVALASGEWLGLGLGDSRQKMGFLPEQVTDFILPVIGEEMGLVTTLAVVLAFMLFVICGMYIASRAPDTFGFLLAGGVTMMITLQAFVNLSVVTNTLPNKGMSLPFISYGGSNLLLMLVSVGILLSIAQQAPEVEEDEESSKDDDDSFMEIKSTELNPFKRRNGVTVS